MAVFAEINLDLGGVAAWVIVGIVTLAALYLAVAVALHRRGTSRREAAWLSYGRASGRVRRPRVEPASVRRQRDATTPRAPVTTAG